MIKIGILSFAHQHAYGYASCLGQIRGVKLVGIWDDHATRGEGAAARFATGFFADVDALLEKKLDGVIICAENARHRTLTELAAPRTRHILCEKPLATTLSDARAMIDTCTANGAKLQTAFPVRFSPPVQWLKELLDEDTVGRVYCVKTTNHGSVQSGWFIDKSLSGGGAVIDHTVHVIDLLRWFWRTEVTEVYAEVGYSLLHRDLGIDDAGLLSFQLANGAYGTLDTSWSRPPSYPTWGDVKLEVLGEKGIIRVDALRQHVAVYSEDSGKGRWVGWGSNMDLGLVKDFIDMIVTGREPSITGHDGLRALEVALGAYESAKTGRPVRLPLEGEPA